MLDTWQINEIWHFTFWKEKAQENEEKSIIKRHGNITYYACDIFFWKCTEQTGSKDRFFERAFYFIIYVYNYGAWDVCNCMAANHKKNARCVSAKNAWQNHKNNFYHVSERIRSPQKNSFKIFLTACI